MRVYVMDVFIVYSFYRKVQPHTSRVPYTSLEKKKKINGLYSVTMFSRHTTVTKT